MMMVVAHRGVELVSATNKIELEATKIKLLHMEEKTDSSVKYYKSWHHYKTLQKQILWHKCTGTMGLK